MNKHLLTIVLCTALAALTATASAQPPTRPGFDRAPGNGFAPPAADTANRGPTSGPVNPMFAAIDADGDGVITSRELRRAVAVLKKMDTDRDGNLTLAEVNAQVVPTGAAAPGLQRGGFTGGRNNFGSQAGVAGRDGVERQQIGQQLLANDRNGDGQLTPDEVPPQLRNSLRGADINRDGTLDAQELQAISQRISERFRGGRALPPGFDPRADARAGGRNQRN